MENGRGGHHWPRAPHLLAHRLTPLRRVVVFVVAVMMVMVVMVVVVVVVVVVVLVVVVVVSCCAVKRKIKINQSTNLIL